ncbi:hypothetical protein PIB30_087739 [Stylosanthes scabra]|uniref:Uncharacterized protein n=1 Tax=Stylosanthes scabra TaxID=79078 RepID=A0ABU6WWX1_9FABA|nr:hypothetical protein [Stylosanthes scabra]
MHGENRRTRPVPRRRQYQCRRKRRICTDSTAYDTSPEHCGRRYYCPALFIPHARSGPADAVHDRGGIRACQPAPGLRFRHSTHFNICGALAAGVAHVPSPVG